MIFALSEKVQLKTNTLKKTSTIERRKSTIYPTLAFDHLMVNNFLSIGDVCTVLCS